MFVHAVYFWLRDDLTRAEKETFIQSVNALTTIETVKVSHVGAPASTDRPIIDRSYSYALTLFFENKADHDVYQEHPVHDAFRDNCGTFWTNIKIYDSVS
jgi:hypothetical protein